MIATRVEESQLLRHFAQALPMIRTRLDEPTAWAGIVVREPARGVAYRRIVCRDQLATSARAFRVSVHAFTEHGYEGELHDHRWPIAVLALDPGGDRGVSLYEMPWRCGDDEGVLLVRSGTWWAIERHRDVLHAVKSLRPHVSIVFADVTEPASRENRMSVDRLDEESVLEILQMSRDAYVTMLQR